MRVDIRVMAIGRLFATSRDEHAIAVGTVPQHMARALAVAPYEVVRADTFRIDRQFFTRRALNTRTGATGTSPLNDPRTVALGSIGASKILSTTSIPSTTRPNAA